MKKKFFTASMLALLLLAASCADNSADAVTMTDAASEDAATEAVTDVAKLPDSVEQIDHLPRTEMVKEKGYEILYFTEDVDEFAIKILGKYMDKEFSSVAAADLDLEWW